MTTPVHASPGSQPRNEHFLPLHFVWFVVFQSMLAGCSAGSDETWSLQADIPWSVHDLIEDSDGNTFAATSGDGGVYCSTDGGTSWTQRNNGLAHTDVHALWIHGSTMFAGTNGGGIYLSTSGGTSWTASNSGITDTDIWSFTENDSALYAAGLTSGGIYRSTDNGQSWQRLTTGLESAQIYVIVRGNDNRLFAGGNTGVFSSTNNGLSWTPANVGLTFEESGVAVESILALENGLVYAGTNVGVFKSEDHAAHWTSSVTISSLDVRSIVRGSDGSIFAGTGIIGVLRSPDGVVWKQFGLANDAVNTLFADEYLYAGTYEIGIYRRPF